MYPEAKDLQRISRMAFRQSRRLTLDDRQEMCAEMKQAGLMEYDKRYGQPHLWRKVNTAMVNHWLQWTYEIHQVRCKSEQRAPILKQQADDEWLAARENEGYSLESN